MPIAPLSSSRRLRDHRLAATSEGEALRTESANHNGLDKRIGNSPISRPLDDEVRTGSPARILSGNEGLHCTKGADRDGLWQVTVDEISRRVEVVIRFETMMRTGSGRYRSTVCLQQP